MRHAQSLLAAVVVLAGLASSASAQGFAVAGAQGNAFSGGFGTGGIAISQGYTGFNTGYGGYYPGYGGFNSSLGGFNNYSMYNGGYGNYGGYNGGYYNSGYLGYGGNYRAPLYPQTQNNMFGLMNTIRTQTGGGNSYRYGYGVVGGRRR